MWVSALCSALNGRLCAALAKHQSTSMDLADSPSVTPKISERLAYSVKERRGREMQDAAEAVAVGEIELIEDTIRRQVSPSRLKFNLV